MKSNKQLFTIIISIITAIACIASINADAQVASDAEMSDQIESELRNNTSLPARLIDVTTEEGIVTLSGTTSNLLARDRIISISKSIKGVRGVINKITIKTPHIPDDELERKVEQALFDDPATESFKIQVQADNNGVVKLMGAVDSWQEKQLAEDVTKGVIGVTNVANELAFVWEEDRPDSEIKADIEGRLRADWRVDDGLIEVHVDDGKVRLTGMVGSAFEKSQAEVDAHVANVTTVDVSNLVVEPYEDDGKFIRSKYVPKSDFEVREAIADAFLYDSRVNGFDINIKVDSGFVTLTGEVDNLMAKKAAALDASNVVGVKDVTNGIKVRPPISVDDKDIVANVIKRLKKDPIVNIYDIDVRAENGKVVLDGKVASAFVKRKAENLAAKAKGAVDIQNLIKVEGLYHHDLEVDAIREFNDNFTYVEPSYDIQDDQTIKNKIETELWWSPFVDKVDIDVDVTNGVATLNGTVDSRKEKKYAGLNALQGGAQRVVNELVVAEIE